MSRYASAIHACVRQAVTDKMSLEQITAPLIENIAVVVVGAQQVTGAKLDDLVEIIRHELDKKVAEHACKIRTGR